MSHTLFPHSQQTHKVDQDCCIQYLQTVICIPITVCCWSVVSQYHLRVYVIFIGRFLLSTINSCCTVVTDFVRREHTKSFSSCNSILKTGPSVNIKILLTQTHQKLRQLLLLTVCTESI